MVQLKLEEEGVEQVYIGEFSASSKYNKHYEWVKVGEKGYVKMSYHSFSMFFIVVFSRTNFYEIQGSKNAMVSENVISFLIELDVKCHKRKTGELFVKMQAYILVAKLKTGFQRIE